MEFVGKRKIWYLISLVLIVVSVGSLLLQGLNFGIDFAGGSLFHLKFADASVKSEQVRSALAEFDLENSSIQEAADDSIIIRTHELTEEKQTELLKSMEEKLGEFETLRNEKVGPVIGKELRRAGLLALLIAGILQIIYITVRFEFKFALAAIIALLHDALITIGFFSILQLEVDVAFIAAILTIIGYSINDTIVIFDRIRENLKNRRKESMSVLVNNSIRQTLTRSINTAVTVVFVLLALIFLGGETTVNFSVAMLVGVVSGAYSSIFLASPLWYDLRGEERRVAAGKKGK